MTSMLEPSMTVTSVPEVIDETGSTTRLEGTVMVDLSTTVPGSNGFDPQPTAVTPDRPSQDLHDSFSDTITDVSQFPMQHATTQLPSNQLSLTTTDTMSRTMMSQSSAPEDVKDNIIKSDSALESTGATNVINSSTDIAASVTFTTGVDSPTDTHTDTVFNSSTPNTDTSVLDPNSGTSSAVQTSVNSVVPTSSFAQKFPDSESSIKSDTKVMTPSSSDYEVTVRDLYSTYTPSETTFMSVSHSMDTVSLQTSSAAVPVPEVTGKPVQPSSKGQSTILGGGLSDNILYIGVPVAGLLILILLLICIICLRRRKNKQKQSPVKEQGQDLWMNSSSEIPLTGGRSTLPETNGGAAISPQKHIAAWDSGDSSLRRRKPHHVQGAAGNMPDIDTGKGRSKSTLNNTDKCSVKPETDSSDDLDLERFHGDGDILNDLDIGDMGGAVYAGSWRTMRPGDSANRSIFDERLIELHFNDDNEGCTRYEAVFDFQGSHGNHLSLQQGDIVHVQRKEDTGWWRGTKGDQSGWFPSNYVQSAPQQDKVCTENEVEMHDDSVNVSSFMLKKGTDVSPRNSFPTEEEIQAEPIYCKIQPKDKRLSGTKLSDRSASTTPTKPEAPVIAETLTPTQVSGCQYIALYPYEAHAPGELTINKGDIVWCKEKDRNGWMKGTNDSTKIDGWCPASYLQKAESKTVLAPDPSSYHQLEVNTDDGNKQDLIGIVHKAVHTFSAEKAGDLEFDSGDYVTVFQVLENGWWLGCKDKTVGWFPGSYVEMIEHPSVSPSPSPVSTQSSNNDNSDELKPVTPTGGMDIANSPLTPNTQSKLKPMRKAPPPPLKIENSAHSMQESKLPMLIGSRTPKQGRPKVAPPEPPVRGNNTENSEEDPGPLYEPIGQKGEVSVGSDKPNASDSDKNNTDVSAKPVKVKPPVPKRFIKPRLVSVPRTEVKIPDLHRSLGDGELMKLRSPPPPRPVAPKLGPIRAKLTAPKPLEDESPIEDDDTLFQVNSQRKFDAILKQNSEEQDTTSPESPPYRTMASFGATFGKTEPSNPVSRSSTFSVPKQPESRADTTEDKSSSAQPAKPPTPATGRDGQTSATTNAKMSEQTDNNAIDKHIDKPVITDDKPVLMEDKPDITTDESAVTEDKPQVGTEKPKPKSSIPLTPVMKASKLPPPKHGVINLKAEAPKIEVKSNEEAAKATTPTEKVSKLPKAKVEGVSKIPTIGGHSKSENDQNIFQYPQVHDSTEKKDSRDESIGVQNIDSQGVGVDESSESRPRTESIGKPPLAPKPKSNLPKVLPKPKPVPKSNNADNKENIKNSVEPEIKETVNNALVSPVVQPEVKEIRQRSTSESETDNKTPSKIPLTSVLSQKSPQSKSKKSGIPSPNVRKPSVDRTKESDTEAETTQTPLSRLESPQMQRKQNKSPEGHANLRNRSNSPANRSGIPKSVRNRSNSPAAKPPGIPTPSGSNKATPKQKRSGLVPPKKVVNGQGKQSPVDTNPLFPQEEGLSNSEKDDSFEQPSSSPDRPSRPPAVTKQPSQDSKLPKSGKSLLPVIHKSLEAGANSPNGVTKQKRGIPVAKPTRPPPPKTPPVEENHSSQKKTLHQAVRGYSAQSDGELSFSEGTFVKELSDCDRPGWHVGMLADGTTGLYPAEYFKPSPLSAQSEA